MTEQDARIQAKKEALFYTHLATFLVVMASLAILNLLTSPGHLWALYVLFGWGNGLANHASEVFGLCRGSSWRTHPTRMRQKRRVWLVACDRRDR